MILLNNMLVKPYDIMVLPNNIMVKPNNIMILRNKVNGNTEYNGFSQITMVRTKQYICRKVFIRTSIETTLILQLTVQC